MSVDARGGRAARPVVALVSLGVLVVAAVVSAGTWIGYGRQLSELGGGFADLATLAQVLAVVYGVLAGVSVLGGALVAGRVRHSASLMRVVLILSVPVQALILFVVISDCWEALNGGVRVVGDRTVALAAVQLTAAVATALATAAGVPALTRRRRIVSASGERVSRP